MAWIHVEDSSPPSSGTTMNCYGGSRHSKTVSNETFGHSIYRCYQCKALWVGKIGDKPDCTCGKCGAKP